MLRVKQDITVRISRGSIPYDLHVPKGTPVHRRRDGRGAFVYSADFSSFIRAGTVEMHDAKRYGVPIDADSVEDDSEQVRQRER